MSGQATLLQREHLWIGQGEKLVRNVLWRPKERSLGSPPALLVSWFTWDPAASSALDHTWEGTQRRVSKRQGTPPEKSPK